jgi:hypothetical protein
MGAKTKKRRHVRQPAPRGSRILYRNAKLVGGTAQVLAHGEAIRPPEASLSPSSLTHKRRP